MARLSGLLRRRRPHWRGIYERFEDVPRRGEGFNSDFWVETTLKGTQAAIGAATRTDELPVIAEEHAMLVMLAATLAGTQESVRVLDFGGGMGIGYVAVSAALGPKAVQYDVVENGRVCAAGETLFPPQAGISFHSGLPDEDYAADIVYVCTALQYVDQYRDVLDQLFSYRPQYVLFKSLSAGTNRSYATEQTNVPGSSIPYWFINRDEIVALAEVAGYRLTFAIADEREHDQSNFPPDYRLGRTCTLLFTRSAGLR